MRHESCEPYPDHAPALLRGAADLKAHASAAGPFCDLKASWFEGVKVPCGLRFCCVLDACFCGFAVCLEACWGYFFVFWELVELILGVFRACWGQFSMFWELVRFILGA